LSQELTFTPVRIETNTADEEGRLVFTGDYLVAVLIQLAEGHETAGHWFLEHGFGKLGVPVPPTFSDLQAAETWIRSRLNGVAHGGATLGLFRAPGFLPPRSLQP